MHQQLEVVYENGVLRPLGRAAPAHGPQIGCHPTGPTNGRFDWTLVTGLCKLQSHHLIPADEGGTAFFASFTCFLGNRLQLDRPQILAGAGPDLDSRLVRFWFALELLPALAEGQFKL